MAGAKGLRYGVMVRNPETLEATVLVAGTTKSDVPDWARELVHDDDFGTVEEASESAGGSPAPTEGYAGMKPEDLQALADERKLEVTGTGANGNVKKGDLVAALEAHDAAQAGA